MRIQKVKQTRLNATDITQFLEINSRMSFHTPYVVTRSRRTNLFMHRPLPRPLPRVLVRN